MATVIDKRSNWGAIFVNAFLASKDRAETNTARTKALKRQKMVDRALIDYRKGTLDLQQEQLKVLKAQQAAILKLQERGVALSENKFIEDTKRFGQTFSFAEEKQATLVSQFSEDMGFRTSQFKESQEQYDKNLVLKIQAQNLAESKAGTNANYMDVITKQINQVLGFNKKAEQFKLSALKSQAAEAKRKTDIATHFPVSAMAEIGLELTQAQITQAQSQAWKESFYVQREKNDLLQFQAGQAIKDKQLKLDSWKGMSNTLFNLMSQDDRDKYISEDLQQQFLSGGIQGSISSKLMPTPMKTSKWGDWGKGDDTSLKTFDQVLNTWRNERSMITIDDAELYKQWGNEFTQMGMVLKNGAIVRPLITTPGQSNQPSKSNDITKVRK